MTSIGVLGERLYEARTAAGLTQQEVASRAGVSRQTVAKIENGKMNSTTVSSLLKVAHTLGFEINLEKQGPRIRLADLADKNAGPTWREENFPDYDGSWWCK